MNDASLGGQRPTKVRWLIFSLACATSWLLYLHRYTWNIVGKGLQEDYGFSTTAVGSLYSCFSAAYGLGQIPSGILSDLVGPHFFLALIIVLWSLMIQCVGLTGNYRLLAGVQILFGAAQAGAYPNLSKVTRNWFPQRTRTIVQGWIATFFGRIGGAMSSIIMGTLLMGWVGMSWQQSLLVMAVPGVLFGGVFLFLFRNSPEVDPRVNQEERDLIHDGQVPTSGGPRVLPVRRALKNRSMLFFVLQQVLTAGADTVFVTFMGIYFLTAKNVDVSSAGWLISLPLWGGAVGGMLGGYCNDLLIAGTGSRRWGRSAIGFAGPAMACALMFVMIQQESALAAGIALCAVKFFADWSQPTVWGTCTDLGGRYSATVFGILNTSGNLGGLAFPIIFGLILDANTTQQIVGGETTTNINFNPLFFTLAGMYITSAVFWFMIDATQSLDRE